MMLLHWIFPVLCMLVPLVSSQDAATHCFEDTQTTAKVYLECPSDFTIVVQGLMFGRNSYRECSYTRDTCVVRPPGIDGADCLGRQNCTITARRMYSVDCGGYVEFFRVIYECFPVVVATNVSLETTTVSKRVVPLFGMDTPVTKPKESSKGPDVGMIVAVVGCVLGTLYISIVCIVLAVLLRRNDDKRHLAQDEEQPTELDNSGFRGSSHLGEHSNSSNTTGPRDSNRNIVSGRPGPDGKEREPQVIIEKETPSGRSHRDRNFNANLQQASKIAPKNLFSTKDISSSKQSTASDNDNNNITQLSCEEPSTNASNC